jgi:hypothetical protein
METFGIDEARELRTLAAHKALGDKKIFLITSARLTLEAQNALLKTFEDPFPNTHFFLVSREEALIKPTLLSRMQTVRLPKMTDVSVLSKEAEKFLSLPLKNRLLFAKKFALDGESLPTFLDSLLLTLKKAKEPRLLDRVYKVRRFGDDLVAAPRLVLEHLALML